jgi:hypothetical protein
MARHRPPRGPFPSFRQIGAFNGIDKPSRAGSGGSKKYFFEMGARLLLAFLLAS